MVAEGCGQGLRALVVLLYAQGTVPVYVEDDVALGDGREGALVQFHEQQHGEGDAHGHQGYDCLLVAECPFEGFLVCGTQLGVPGYLRQVAVVHLPSSLAVQGIVVDGYDQNGEEQGGE